jgi:hypothetical protein
MDSDGSENVFSQIPDRVAPKTHAWYVSHSLASRVENDGGGKCAYSNSYLYIRIS